MTTRFEAPQTFAGMESQVSMLETAVLLGGASLSASCLFSGNGRWKDTVSSWSSNTVSNYTDGIRVAIVLQDHVDALSVGDAAEEGAIVGPCLEYSCVDEVDSAIRVARGSGELCATSWAYDLSGYKKRSRVSRVRGLQDV